MQQTDEWEEAKRKVRKGRRSVGVVNCPLQDELQSLQSIKGSSPEPFTNVTDKA